MAHLQVVPVLVNGVTEKKALLDSGSQIVSMTREVAAANKITWDPSLSIQLQSVNGSLSRTCRLAKNVPFTLGDVTVLLQVHVMETAPYKILLGRPFDTITESTIINDQEGNQTISITCPNTGTKAAIPTYKWGTLPRRPDRDPGTFSINLKESVKTTRREVPCIIEMDREGKSFVLEVLPLEIEELSWDEVQLLYLQKSDREKRMIGKPVLEQLFTELKQSGTGKRMVTAIEEDSPNADPKEQADVVCFAKKYKPVALKVKTVLGTLPERFRIIREIKGDPLKDIPKLPEKPPEFVPKGRYTGERKEKLDMRHMSSFLWLEERKLMHWVIAEQNQAFAWEDSERGKFKEEYFPLIEILMVAHIPSVKKPFRIPPAIYEEVCGMIKKKIDVGVYELLNCLYRSQWFCVIKKDGKSLCIVHSLKPLNRVTIAHSGLPPATEELAMHFAGRAYSGILDLYVGYDERVLAEHSRDLMTFQTPFRVLRLVILPIGWTNSVPIFHDDVIYILRDEIPKYTLPYIDDVLIRGPMTRYERPDGTVEVLEKNPGIWRFVFEHLETMNRIL